MAWVVLLLSAVLEAVWATALGRSEGFSQPVPSVVFLVALVLSMAGLARAVQQIPIGTAYAVWVGIGAALTVVLAMATGAEEVSPAKVVFLTGIVGAVVGLKLAPGGRVREGAAALRSSGAGTGEDRGGPGTGAGAGAGAGGGPG